MKRGVVIFHSNIRDIYKDRWINKSVSSIINQTDTNFKIYEIDYGGGDCSVIPKNCKINSNFWSIKLKDYAEAMNFIISEAFNDGCDMVFNTNLDDYYSPDRISKQSSLMIEGDYDIVSSDFCYISESNDEDRIIRFMNICRFGDIKLNLESQHNVIAHPSVCYNKRFWGDLNNRYDSKNIPKEDLHLWINSIKNGYKFAIHPEVLLFYRIHKNQVSNK